MTTDLEAASEAFYTALNAVLGGDAGPMLELWSHEPDITYMSPFGELLSGWEPVRASWEGQAAAGLAGEVRGEEVQLVEGDVLGFTVGFERGEVQVEGRPTAVDIRATSMFRRESGGWRMIGHHTDPLG